MTPLPSRERAVRLASLLASRNGRGKGGWMTDNNDWAAALEGPPKKPLRRRTKILLWLFAALVAWLTLSNASFLAPDPHGKPRLIAHRGVHHLYDQPAATGRDPSNTRAASPPHHARFEKPPHT